MKYKIPENTFIHSYMQHMENQETATDYDFWTALWAISAAIGRMVVVDRPRAPVYLNIYCILVADSGVTRKSTAIRMATTLFKELSVRTATNTRLIETFVTPEELEYRMSQDSLTFGTSSAVMSISELVTVLGKSRAAGGMVGLLTDLYDCPSTRLGGGTKTGGGVTLRNVFLSFLSASTPSWLMKAITKEVVEGGFTSRCIFVVSEDRKKAIPWPDADDGASWRVVADKLHVIYQKALRHRKLKLNAQAVNVFSTWYKQREQHADAYQASFESREDAHVLRIAGLLAINDNSWLVMGHHIRQAIKIIAVAKLRGSQLFLGHNEANVYTIMADRIRVALIEAGLDGLSTVELRKIIACGTKTKLMHTILVVMHELDMIQKFSVQISAGRPKTIWRATTKLTQPKAIETVVHYAR